MSTESTSHRALELNRRLKPKLWSNSGPGVAGLNE
jgi:hypothetical protein